MKIMNLKLFTTFYRSKPAYAALLESRAIVFIEGSLHGKYLFGAEYRTESSMKNFGWRRIS